MKKYKKMTAMELVKLITQTPFDKEVAFAYGVYKEGILEGELTEDDLFGWYGFKKLKAIDSAFVVINRYGGDCLSAHEFVGSSYGDLEKFVFDYFDEQDFGEVIYVELEDE